MMKKPIMLTQKILKVKVDVTRSLGLKLMILTQNKKNFSKNSVVIPLMNLTQMIAPRMKNQAKMKSHIRSRKLQPRRSDPQQQQQKKRINQAD